MTEKRVTDLERRADRLEDLSIELANLTIETRAMLVEMRRENRQTRRIWIAIARKQELFDDKGFKDVFGDED